MTEDIGRMYGVRGEDRKTIKTIEGLVERIDEEYTKGACTFYNFFRFGDNKYKGVFLAIKTEGLVQHAEFPEEFSPPERDALVGKDILYKVTSDSIYKGDNSFLNRFAYELEVLNSRYKGWKIKKIICYDSKE